MRKDQGFTLIEVVIFIVILGVIMAATLRMFKSVLIYTSRPGYMLTASQLADARMNLILLQRKVNGFTSIVDPCSSGSLAACTTINTFATNNGYVISSSIPNAVNGVRTATVTVSGTGDATVMMRFVQ